MAVGKSLPRKDSYDKVNGIAKYIDDYQFSGMVHAKIVRSPYARANILSINKLSSWKDEWVLVTPEDIEGENIVHVILDDQPAIAEKITNYVGEAVAIVVASSENEANEALKAIEVEYEPLEPLLDARKALNHDSIKLFGDDNVFTNHRMINGDVDPIFEREDVVIVEGVYEAAAQEHAYLENQGCIVVPNESETYTAYGSIQCPYYVHTAVAKILGVDKSKFEVIQTVTGGAFGGKEDVPSLVVGLCAIAAQKVHKPVKLIYSREEDIDGTSKRHPGYMIYRTAASKDGTLLAVEADLLYDSGAYSTLSPAVIWRGVVHVLGPYRCPNVSVEGYAVATNKVPNGAFRGFGSVQVLFACESQMDRLAVKLNMDPAELRRKNLLVEGDVTAFKQLLDDSVGGMETLEQTLKQSDWSSKWKPNPDPTKIIQSINTHPKRKGIGIATIFYGVGLGGIGKALSRTGAYVQVHQDGSAVFAVGTIEMGQGMITVLSQILADELGISYDRIRMLIVRTTQTPDSGPTVASRATTFSGRAIIKACAPIRKSIMVTAAEMLDKEVIDLFKEDRFIKVINEPTNKIAIDEVISQAFLDRKQLASFGWDVETPDTDWNEKEGHGNAYVTYAWATNVAEVEVDLETGEVTVEKIYAAHDVGRAINPQTVEGQIEGGTIQGLGYARFEQIVWNKDGKILSNNLGTYIVPGAKDVPEIVSIIVESNYAEGPYGAKGFAEQPVMGIAPAITNAVYNAIGLSPDSIPILPEKIWALIKQYREEMIKEEKA
ncbi:MAG: xanthine dehydrogenase family protein molybdopterin-binding subunit [Candidatus Kariarchaeaceae archaeon]